MKSRVTDRGQITIPKRLRERLGIRPGQILEFAAEDGRLVATKADERDPVSAVYGILGTGRSTDAYIDEVRGPVDTV
jgi:AbrB family looped-hinge helix DNA binding protein